jgi:TRAP-type mannitol/chloroaromatic compound transport system permease small subunit
MIYFRTAAMTAKIMDEYYCPDIRTAGFVLPVFREVFMLTGDYHRAMREFVLADIFYNSVGSVPDLRKYFKVGIWNNCLTYKL